MIMHLLINTTGKHGVYESQGRADLWNCKADYHAPRNHCLLLTRATGGIVFLAHEKYFLPANNGLNIGRWVYRLVGGLAAQASLYYFLIESALRDVATILALCKSKDFFFAERNAKKINKRLEHAACTCCRLVKWWPLKETRLSRFSTITYIFLVSY